MNKLVSLIKREFQVAVHDKAEGRLTLFPKGKPSWREAELLPAVVELALLRAFKRKTFFPQLDELTSLYFCAGAEYGGNHPKYPGRKVGVINPPVHPNRVIPWGKEIVAKLVRELAKAKFRVEKENSGRRGK